MRGRSCVDNRWREYSNRLERALFLHRRRYLCSRSNTLREMRVLVIIGLKRHQRGGRPPSGISTRHLGSKPTDFGFELEHHRHPDKVEPLTSQLLDPPDLVKIGIAVAPTHAAGPGWRDQTSPFVSPQCLRMHAGEFGSHRNDIDRSVVARGVHYRAA